MESPSDADLLRLARRFDLNALTAIYDRYNQALYYYALRLLGDPALAEDCVAETFSRLLGVLRAGLGPDYFLKAYLYRSAHNWITDFYRREPLPCSVPLETLVDPSQGDPLEMVAAHMSQQRVRSALRMLTPDQRQVISLRFIEGWDIEDVAIAINKPVGAVKSLQHRAIMTLRKLLGLDSKPYGLAYEV